MPNETKDTVKSAESSTSSTEQQKETIPQGKSVPLKEAYQQPEPTKVEPGKEGEEENLADDGLLLAVESETLLNKKEKPTEEEERKQEPTPEELELKKQEGLKKETERLLSIVSDLRKQKTALKKQVAEEEEEEEEEEETDETISAKNKTEMYIAREFAKRDFYDAHPEIYKGQGGLKNRQAIEDYIRFKFNPQGLDPATELELLEMVHKQFYGAYEQESAVRDAKNQTRNQMLLNDIAAAATDRSRSTLTTKTPPKEMKFPKPLRPSEWYPKEEA
ncbi:MAG: hypothetical protein ACOZAL_01060 [Patescibacteria group bacterium]